MATQKEIDTYIAELMKQDPVKFVTYCLVVIGRDIYKSNADTFKFNTEASMEDGNRFKIEIKGKIKKVSNP